MEEKEILSEQSGKSDSVPARVNSSKQDRGVVVRFYRIRVLLLVLVAGFIGYSIGVTKINLDWKNFQPHVVVVNREPPPSLTTVDFAPLWSVMDRLADTYYDKEAIDSQRFLTGAIEGLVNSLDDPYTVYLPPVKNEDFKQGLAGKFEGIGAELGMNGKQIIVIAPLDGSPAQKAGLRPGDAILKVDSDFITGWTLNKAVEKIRGEKGTEVVLLVLHKSETKPSEIRIVRDTITVKSITTWIKKIREVDEINTKNKALGNFLDDRIVYVRLSQFGDSTNKEWQSTAAFIDRQYKADNNIRGMILDLRNNPGGYMSDAVHISSEFLKSGIVVSQEDREKDNAAFRVTGQGLLYDIPLVILINEGSASASEIVAGALRDHGRAVLVGEVSFGKGTIQQAEDLGGGAGLHVTIAKWLTPNGEWVHQKGLLPEVKVGVDKKDASRDLQLEKAIETLLKE